MTYYPSHLTPYPISDGPTAAATSALIGGFILAMIEGVTVLITRYNSDAYKPVMPTLPDMV